jgi:hypothetical protein
MTPPDHHNSAQREAEEFLRENLSAPAAAKDMEEHARAVGISSRTLARARKKLGVIAEKGGMDKGWTWRLPGPSDQQYAPTLPKNAKPPEECLSKDWQPSAKLAASSTPQGRAPDVTDGAPASPSAPPHPTLLPGDRHREAVRARNREALQRFEQLLRGR